MSAAGVARRGRKFANSLMLDRCEIRAKPTFGDLDPDTGTRPEVPGSLIYGPTIAPHFGRCKVQTFEAHEATPQSGQHTYSVQRYSVHVPADVEVPTDYRVTITASQLDEHLVGREYRVAAHLHKTMATANRMQVDEVTG